jgi:hypothetical protein
MPKAAKPNDSDRSGRQAAKQKQCDLCEGFMSAQGLSKHRGSLPCRKEEARVKRLRSRSTSLAPQASTSSPRMSQAMIPTGLFTESHPEANNAPTKRPENLIRPSVETVAHNPLGMPH